MANWKYSDAMLFTALLMVVATGWFTPLRHIKIMNMFGQIKPAQQSLTFVSSPKLAVIAIAVVTIFFIARVM